MDGIFVPLALTKGLGFDPWEWRTLVGSASPLMDYLGQWVSDTGWLLQDKKHFYNLHLVGMLGIRLNILPYDSPDLGNHPIKLDFRFIRYPSLGHSRKILPFQPFLFHLCLISSSIMPISLKD